MRIIETIIAAITLLQALILLRAVISFFVSPYSTNRLVTLLRKTTDPILDPVREVLPATEGVDLSPLIVLVGLELVKRILM